MLAISATLSAYSSFTTTPTMIPPSINHEVFTNDDSFLLQGKLPFQKALSSVGLITVTGIPGYAAARAKALAASHACVATAPSMMTTHIFDDGTVRKTLASQMVPGGIMPPMMDNESTPSGSCRSFVDASAPFRTIVADATATFARRLAALANVKEPLLHTVDGFQFGSVTEVPLALRSASCCLARSPSFPRAPRPPNASPWIPQTRPNVQVVAASDHLEHFHSYSLESSSGDSTIDLHTDQGLFIAFAPALMVHEEGDGAVATFSHAVSAGDFLISLPDGTHARLDLDSDALVFMLGDGVERAINPKLSDGSPQLRATPHALRVPQNHPAGTHRTWYGRMVLLPSSAVVEGVPSTNGTITYGDIRAASLPGGTAHGSPTDLGCSGTGVVANRRELQSQCKQGSMYCWHRCMSLEAEGVDESSCSAKGEEFSVQCVNPRDQLWGGTHGDYYPSCTASTQEETPYPPLPNAPRKTNECGADAWQTFARTDGYAKSAPIANSWHPAKAVLMWNVDGDRLDAKLVYDGLFGWLGFGFANVGGAHNGMNGATIALGLPGGKYSARTGLDTSKGPSIMAYKIHEKMSAFRHWSDPIADVPGGAVEANDCFTSISFKADGIGSKKFNLNGGHDQMIWAANTMDLFVGYHSWDTRGVLRVNWADGTVVVDEQRCEVCTFPFGSNSLLMGTIFGPIAVIILVLAICFGCYKKKVLCFRERASETTIEAGKNVGAQASNEVTSSTDTQERA